MLNAQANGQGPNLANLQLQQATNQNNQQAAGQLASQRGMNPALAQRIISQQQAMNNQNAAGQSGILRAQQQLAAQQGLGNVLGQQATEANQQFGENENAIGAQNQAVASSTNSANQANAQIAQNNTNQNAGIAGGLLNSVGSVLGLGKAKGGEIDSPQKHLERLLISIGSKVKPAHLAFGGGFSGNPSNAIDPGLSQGPSSQANNLFGGVPSGLPKDPMAGATSSQGQDSSEFGGSSVGSSGVSSLPGVGELLSNPGALALAAAHGAKIPRSPNAIVSPGERFVPPHMVHAVESGKAKASKVAAKFPGKAKVDGDNEKNDVIPAALAPGGVVIPRSKADNDADAREFLLALKADKDKKSGPSGYAKVLKAKRA